MNEVRIGTLIGTGKVKGRHGENPEKTKAFPKPQPACQALRGF
jgi:hypothetical protein